MLKLIVAAAVLATGLSAGAQPTNRVVRPLDSQWRFHNGDKPGAETVDFDDDSWQRVDVPHDWSIEGPFDADAPARGDGAFLPTGVGWYRKHFHLPTDLNNHRIIVEFDGVMANSVVWINGQHVGNRPNGYVSFYYDITDHVKFGDAPNVIAVRADTSQQVASRWYMGSGIYRHVRLTAVEPVHVEPWGVFVTTPEIHEASAEVAVEISLQNDATDRDVLIHLRAVDPDGAEVATHSVSQQVAANASADVRARLAVPKPQLWDIDSPQLYRLETVVETDGRTVDSVTTPFGIRTSEFRSDTGYWLNGRNVKFKGVCLHHDGGAVGAAVPLGVWEYRLGKLRELGVNAIRTAHNPVAPEFLDLCDRMGFLVMSEFFDCWTVAKRRYDYHRHFNEWAHRDMRDTIRRDRNHPSIILYSVGNEIRDTPKEEHAKKILRGLVDVCHQTDPTRPVTQALFRPNVSRDYDNGLADMLDVIGTNYRDFELLDAWRDKPSRKIVGTEQGHDRKIWLAARDNPQYSGQFLWVGVDYLGESRRWPVTTFDSGLLDRTGWPHPRGLERQSWWSDIPMVAIFRRVAPTEDTPTDPGYEVVEWQRQQVLFPDWSPRDSAPLLENVEIYSNCESVELLLNGESLGAKPLPPDAAPRQWQVEFAPGELVAIGRNRGEEVTRQTLRTAQDPHSLQLTARTTRLGRMWDDVAIVEVTVVDAAGTVVPRAEQMVSFHINDAGQLIGVDNGSIVSHEPFQASQRRAFHGRCIALIRAVADSGQISLTARAKNLAPATIEFEIED